MSLTAANDGIALSQVVEGNPVATIVIDAGHRVTHWNRACAVLTGVPAGEMVGCDRHWQAFYSEPRPILADLIVDEAAEAAVASFYGDKFRYSRFIDGAWEAEDFFPALGDGGRWLFFTAAAIRDSAGRIVGAIETLQDVTERRRAEEALRESEERYRMLSLTDPLTGLFNTRHLQQQLTAEIERATRYGPPLSLMVFDCDNFKRVNDSFGHLEGDRVLQCLADVIRHSLRRSDSAFRYGGEEFVVLLPETDAPSARSLAERLRAAFSACILTSAGGDEIRCTVSIGVAQWEAGTPVDALIRRADEACYRAKALGKNRVVLAGLSG